MAGTGIVTFDPSRLIPGALVQLPNKAHPVTLVAVQPGAFWKIHFEGPDGTGKATFSEAELAEIAIVERPAEITFDGDPNLFRLAVEAHRIQVSFAHDMAALAVSNIQPLPHQLEAVYDCFLREPRTRFLLADDPGAGKTIMAGLYMKELMLRHAGDRILVVTPANLRPQWARELVERFDMKFTQLEAGNFDAHPGENPWDVYDHVIVSRDFLKSERVVEAFAHAERPWDLAVIDEAHGYTISVDGKGFIKDRSERYKAAELVAMSADRLILLTATPHSGRDASLWALLRLLDMEAVGDRMPKHVDVLPERYRKVSKENMKDMAGNDLFRPRHPQTVEYELVGPEWELYEAVTDFVSRQLREISGENSKSAAGFALTTMQRRLASSVRAILKTLERRLERIERALDDPEEYLRKRAAFKAAVIPDSDAIEDLDENDLWKLEEKALEEWLPETVAELELEREALGPLLTRAQEVEALKVEKKLTELLDVVRRQGLADDQRKKLLIFTEHKDTLDYLLEHLQDDFAVAQIHGRLKLSERIAQERYFREHAQIMVATEAAGEGINLQFCNLMVNYDIPWNPNRLEQRMGRIHRIGQTEDVYVFNLVAANTREGYVLATLLRKMENMGKALGDPVFDVIGKSFAGYRLRELLEAVVVGDKTREEAVAEFGGDAVDPEARRRAEELLERALAKTVIDWQALRQQAERAEERRLPPTYFERFFLDAIGFAGGTAERRLDPGTIRVTRAPDVLVASSRASGEFRRVAPEYKRLTFDKSVATRPRTTSDADLPVAELCGPGHPLFDALVDHVIDRSWDELARGAVLLDPDTQQSTCLAAITGDVIDWNGDLVHRALATVRIYGDGRLERPHFATLYDLVAPDEVAHPDPAAPTIDVESLEMWARQNVFEDIYRDAKAERDHVAEVQLEFLARSFNSILAQADEAILAADDEVANGVQGAAGRLRKAELAKSVQVLARDKRIAQVRQGRAVSRGDLRAVGVAQLLHAADAGRHDESEHPPKRDDEIEAIAVQVASTYEREIRQVDYLKSVESDNVGFDLLSLKGLERRCIEVKGRAGVWGVELTWSEYAKAVELGDDYWLYAVLDCASPDPRLFRIQNPVRALAGLWKPNLDVRFAADSAAVIDAAQDEAL
jgi:superfamily II DNA or RNA helicase